MGLPNGVIKRGVLIIGVRKLGVLDPLLLGVLDAGSTWSPPKESSGDRDRDGEWNCDGGADIIGGVISRGVIGVDTGGVDTIGVIVRGVIGVDTGGVDTIGVLVRGVIGADIGGVDSRGVIGRGVMGVELTSL